MSLEDKPPSSNSDGIEVIVALELPPFSSTCFHYLKAGTALVKIVLSE